MTQAERLLVFAGSYAEPDGAGICVYAFDPATEALSLTDQIAGLKNPTFLQVDAPGRKLYAIAEGLSAEGTKKGLAICYSIDPEHGRLTERNRSTTVGHSTCHIQRDRRGRYLMVASYHGSQIGLSALNEDGSVGALLDVRQHTGSGPNPDRQSRPHPHSCFFSPDNRFAFVCDLGLDLIRAYTIDPDRRVLQPHGDTRTHPGAGPRHLAFHPNGGCVFVINEIDSTISSFRYDAEAGKLEMMETVPTLPADFHGENTCAEIAVSADGRFLYGSNRGHDSLVAYRIEPDTGRLSLVERVSAEGKHPRHFSLTPDNRFLLAANRDTDNIAIFRVDPESGRPAFTGHEAKMSKPVCVQSAYFPR